MRTFSIGFNVPEYDETRYARLAADRFRTIHEEFRVEPNAAEILPRLIWHFDEPFADSSALPTWYLAELTRQHVTVALTGDGGDELFAGYPPIPGGPVCRLPRSMASSVWHVGRRLLIGKMIPFIVPAEVEAAAVETICRGYGLSARSAILEWIATFGEARRAWLYREEHLAQLPDADPLEFLTAALKCSRGRHSVTSVSLADLLTYLPCDLMTKVDTASWPSAPEYRQFLGIIAS